MSDILDEGIRWLRHEAECDGDRMDDHYYKDNFKWKLANEIERLRRRIENLESMGTSESARMSKLLVKERERIAELEDDKAFWKNPPNGVWVEKDQIDKAWALASYRGEEDPVPERMLKELGIVRCDCEREIDHWTGGEGSITQTMCPNCCGRGWVKHE